jgi:hypothetical protein
LAAHFISVRAPRQRGRRIVNRMCPAEWRFPYHRGLTRLAGMDLPNRPGVNITPGARGRAAPDILAIVPPAPWEPIISRHPVASRDSTRCTAGHR